MEFLPNGDGRRRTLAELYRGLAHALGQEERQQGFERVRAARRTVRARRAAEPLLAPNVPSRLVDTVLKLWVQYWKSPDAVAEARRLAGSAPIQQRLAYATYFNEVDSPEDAAALVGDSPHFPLNRTNLSSNSVIATLLALQGRSAEAQRVFDAILAEEPDHVYALRGRINL